MKILAVDSSGPSAASAITGDDDLIIADYYQNNTKTHSETLLPMIESMLRCAKTELSEVDLFAVTAGPGSFTGLRIGIATVKGLAWATNKPCAGVSALLALAETAAGLADPDALICPVMDARNRQVYNALFQGGEEPRRLCADRTVLLDQLEAELCEIRDKKQIILVGDGAGLCYNKFIGSLPVRLAPAELRFCRGFGVARAARRMAAKGETVSASLLTPVYLQLPQAERERLLKQGEKAE